VKGPVIFRSVPLAAVLCLILLLLPTLLLAAGGGGHHEMTMKEILWDMGIKTLCVSVLFFFAFLTVDRHAEMLLGRQM
jgi:hypothetical protein